MLEYFHNRGFTSILVHFDIPDHIFKERVVNSQRSTAIFRSASTFEEVLAQQQAASNNSNVTTPNGEADYLLVIQNSKAVASVLKRIVDISQSL